MAAPAAAAELCAALAAGAPDETQAATLAAQPSASEALAALSPAEVVALLRRACDDADVAAWLARDANALLARLREVGPQARPRPRDCARRARPLERGGG